MPYLRFYKMIPVFENIFHIFYFLPHEDYTTALPRPKAFYFDIIRQTPTVSRRFHIKDASRSRLQNNDNPFIPQNKKAAISSEKLYHPVPGCSRQSVFRCIYFTSKVLAIFSLPFISSTSIQISAVFPIAASTNFIPPSTKSGDNL